jgi:aconitate hydratase
MTAVGQDSLGTRSTLNVGGKSYAYYSLKKAAEKLGDVSRLPFSHEGAARKSAAL